MEDFYMNISSQDQSYHYTNSTYDNDYSSSDSSSIMFVMTCAILSLGLPLSLAAIVSLRAQVSSDHVAPIYVINLLLSDLLQFGCMIFDLVPNVHYTISGIFSHIYFYSLIASVGFMVCVALERYLVIVHPLWYRCRRTIKSTVVVCVVVWLLPLVNFLTRYLRVPYLATNIVFSTFLLLPLPLLIFFLGATVKALSASVSVSSEEKRRIVGVLVLVLLIYRVMFLPTVFGYLMGSVTVELIVVFSLFLHLNPLADLVLYVFMRKGAVDKLLAAVCCC